MNKKNFCDIVLIFVMVVVVLSSFVVAGVKLCYPYAYSKEISYYSKKYELDESLVRAIIKVESGYDALSFSVAGARGLMQIMPSTGKWIAEELGVVSFRVEMLFDPRLNIEMGCFYLNYLFNKYENQHKVLFSYNAGEGVMNSYYKEDDALVIETIEIKETREYIEKVTKARSGYMALDALFN